MTTFLYFAYGSNMLTERLVDRCPGARPVAVATAVGYTLSFSKRSNDGSGKAMLEQTDGPEDIVPGVLFEIYVSERSALDTAEGAGFGYRREEGFLITRADTGEHVAATVYLAEDTHIDGTLIPYEWYRTLAVAGAHQHGLPEAWIARLAGFAFERDPVPGRKARQDALRVLERAGYAHLLPLPEAA